MKSMKRNFWKKTAAGIMAVMILSGGVPILDMPGLFEKSAITAKADDYVEVTKADGYDGIVNRVLSGAHVKLMNDITIERYDESIWIGGSPVIDLNGHCLYLKGSGAWFYLQNSSDPCTLTVKDSTIDPNTYQVGQKIGAIVIDNSVDKPASCVAVAQDGIFVLESGAIIGNIDIGNFHYNGVKVKFTSPYGYYSSVASGKIEYTDKCSAPVGERTANITYGNGKTATLKHGSVNSDYYFGKGSDGSAEKPYTISNRDGWNAFCEALLDKDKYNRFSGKIVQLGSNISVSRMAGSSDHDFCGIFNGNGKTLTFNYGSDKAFSNEQYIAPFRYVTTVTPEGGEEIPVTIKNLHVNGNIYTSAKYAAGIISRHWGTVNVENCRSSIVIHSSVNGDGTHGGITAVQGNGTLNVKGCVFDGKLLGSSTNACGGFVGWRKGTVNVSNSLYAPAGVSGSETWMSSADGYTLSRRNATSINNCYYTTPFGTTQGKQAHIISAGKDVTISLADGSTVGVNYNGKVYAANSEKVNLKLEYKENAPTGYTTTFTASAGTLNGNTLTMPNSDVIINASNIANTYSVVFNKNASDATGTMAAQSFTYDAEKALTANAFKRTGWTFAGWATSANGDVVYTDKQAVKNLTAENGKTVTLYAKWTQNDYTISKSAEHGTIKVKVNNSETSTAHYSDTVKVEVTPDTGYYVKSVKYNNKSVTLQNNAGSFTMPAENVTVNAEMAKRNYDVSYDSGIQHGTVTADKTNADYGEKVSVTVEPDTGYSIKNVTMNGTVLTPVNGTYEFNMPAGEAVLKAEFTANDYTISLKPNVQNGTLRADKLTAKYGEKVTLTLTPDNNYILKYVVVVGEKGADLTKVDDTHYTFNMPAEDVTVNCEYITFTKVEAVAPTCTEDGHIAYYLGSDGLFYADTNGTLVEDINNDRIINQADIVVKATGHSYVVDSSEWAEVNDHYYVTVYAKCSVCGKVDSIGYANVSYDDYEITKEATADETGIKTYTATVDYMGEEFTVTKNVEIPKIQAVASVNGTAYDSLKDAIKAADDGDVVILGDDVNESGLYLGDYYKPVTLDLNHHTVVLGSLNIEDNLTIKNGTLTCYISNCNTGNDNTLTLDAATINAPNGLQWLATHIAVKNGSKLNLSENVYCGGGSEDGFSLTIDDTSSVVLNNTVPSGYNEELVRSEFGKYLPDGYSFVYNETKYEYEIVDANGKVVTDPIQIPAPSYHISVTDGKLSTGKTSGDIQVSKLVTVKAGTVAGKTFSHWERNGKKVSTNATYSFYMPSEDVTLTAVFNEIAADPAGTAIIESVKAASNKLSFVSVLNIPKNCKYVKGGLVATTDATIGENVSADSAQFVKLSTKATANSKNVKYTWTKSVSGETVVYVRAYLVYKDSNGKEQTVYSACVMADKNGEIRVK